MRTHSTVALLLATEQIHSTDTTLNTAHNTSWPVLQQLSQSYAISAAAITLLLGVP
jgi:hypothetical protein